MLFEKGKNIRALSQKLFFAMPHIHSTIKRVIPSCVAKIWKMHVKPR